MSDTWRLPVITRYASAALALAAALTGTGIIGETHDRDLPGIAGITALGWGAALVALLSFGVILVQTYGDQAKINWQVRQRAKVRRIANDQVLEAMGHLLAPFNILVREIWTTKSNLEIDLDKLDKNPEYLLDLLSNPAVRAELEHVDLRARPNVSPPILWWEYFAKMSSETRELLNQAAAKYSGYLDPDTLVAIENIRADELVYFRLPGLGELESMNQQINPLPLTYAFGIIEGWRAFDIMIEKLKAVLSTIDASLARGKLA